MDDLGQAEHTENVGADHTIVIGTPSAPFFAVEADGTCTFQGREIGIDSTIHSAFLRNAFWLESLEENPPPFLGNAPAGYASTCAVDGSVGLELVLPFSEDMPGEPYNRVLISPYGSYKALSERSLSDEELWDTLRTWAHAGIN